jgi:predicted transcriptional regulator
MTTFARSAAVRVLDALILAKKPCTAAELGKLSRRIVRCVSTTECRQRLRDRWCITRPLRSLRERGLIERAPNPRRSARKGRPPYVYVPTADGRAWLIDKRRLL